MGENMVKVGINGFGRIGRLTLRAMLKHKDIDVVAVNDITDAKTLAHLFKYDSTYGKFQGDVKNTDDEITINGKGIKVLSVRNPAELPWSKLGVDIVIESTGIFRDANKAKAHIEAGAKKVVISAPAKNEDITIVLGVNDEAYDPDKHHIISNASCTTNCFAPMVKVLNETFGVDRGFMTTIHSYTADQRLQDAPHKDLRRARAAAQSMIPTTTGAAKAIGLVIPEMKGKLDAISVRVPTIDGSLVDFVCALKKNVTADEINNAFKEYSKKYPDYIEYLDEPLVSCDIIGNTHSLIFDSLMTFANGNVTKVLGWYDNEMGYSCRLADLVTMMGKKGL